MRIFYSILFSLICLSAISQQQIKQSTYLGFLTVTADGTIFIVDGADSKNPVNHITFLGSSIEISMSMLDSSTSQRTYISSNDLFEAQYLDYRLQLNGRLIQDWTPASSLSNFEKDTIIETLARPFSAKPASTDEIIVHGRPLKRAELAKLNNVQVVESPTEQHYTFRLFLVRKILFKRELGVGDTLRIDVRDQRNKFRVPSAVITRKSIKPILNEVIVDEMIDHYFMRPRNLEGLQVTGRSSKTDRDTTTIAHNLSFPSDTKKILLLFTPVGLVDSSLMVCNSSNDSNNWRLSGHKILINDLKPGSSRDILVHYKLQPESTVKYTITTAPTWYQTKTFRWILMTAGAVLFLLSIFVLYRYSHKKQKQREERINLQLKSIRSQLNPHFVFNALSSIQGLINNNEIDKANMYLSEFGTLMRNTLSGNNLISNNLATEVKMIERYLQLEQLRFGFKFDVDVDPSLDISGIEIPSLLIQPIVENAVKHGVSSLLDKGYVNVSINKSHDDLLIEITDNGKGFISSSERKGDGMRLTTDRVNLLNQVSKDQQVEYLTQSSGAGTTVHLNFKNWL